MFYTKNVPGWERALRMFIGLAACVVAWVNWGVSTPAVVVALLGAAMAVTGLAGFCPMCAMVGRKIGKGS